MNKIYIANYICRAVAFVCITVATIYFQKPSLLWWYLLPFFMGLSSDNKRSDNNAE